MKPLALISLLCFSASNLTAQDKPTDPDTKTSQGPATDRSNNAVEDPSGNVRALSEAANKRQDDLRECANLLNKERNDHMRELGEMREKVQVSIRQVDREDLNKQTANAQQNIATLAKTTADTAETLRQQVAAVEKAATQQRTADNAEFNKRLQIVETSQSEGRGKQAFADPQMERLNQLVETLAATQSQRTGTSAGISSTMGMFFTIGGLVLAGLTFLMTMLLRQSKANGRSINNSKQTV